MQFIGFLNITKEALKNVRFRLHTMEICKGLIYCYSGGTPIGLVDQHWWLIM